MTFTPLTEAVEALALDPAMIIMQFVQQLAAAIYLGNKKANRVLNIDKTSVAMRNQKMFATLDEEGKLRWCVEHEDKMQNNKDPTNTSKVDHYFSALLAIIKIKWGLALSIKCGNQVSFEDLVTCYETHTNYPSLTNDDEAIFNLATTQYKALSRRRVRLTRSTTSSRSFPPRVPSRTTRITGVTNSSITGVSKGSPRSPDVSVGLVAVLAQSLATRGRLAKQNIKDASKGYIVDDTLVIVCHVQCEPTTTRTPLREGGK